VVVVSGVSLYALHRGLPYIVILFLLRSFVIKKFKLVTSLTPATNKLNLVSTLEGKLATERSTARKKDDSVQRWLDAQAAEIHFMYVAAWGLFAAVGASQFLGKTIPEVRTIVLTLAVLFLLGALIRDYMFMTWEVKRAFPSTIKESSIKES
jgi:hypothetical protein